MDFAGWPLPRLRALHACAKRRAYVFFRNPHLMIRLREQLGRLEMLQRYEKLEPLVERVIAAESRHKPDAKLDREVALFLYQHGRALVRDVKRVADTEQPTEPPVEGSEPVAEEPATSTPDAPEAPASAPDSGASDAPGTSDSAGSDSSSMSSDAS